MHGGTLYMLRQTGTQQIVHLPVQQQSDHQSLQVRDQQVPHKSDASQCWEFCWVRHDIYSLHGSVRDLEFSVHHNSLADGMDICLYRHRDAAAQ
jgi:hypothetical protein